jgi:hypothetical protein
VAVNHLLSTRRRRAEQPAMSFEAFAEDLAGGLDEPYDAGEVDDGLLAEEVKIGCTQAMLLCLDRPQRMAYILGELFELPGEQAAELLGVTPAAYRKRLSRARARIEQFMRGHCGVLDPTNPCRCERRVGAAIRQRRVDPAQLLFARSVRRPMQQMQRLEDAAAVLRSHPELRAPDMVSEVIAHVLCRDSRSTDLATAEGSATT